MLAPHLLALFKLGTEGYYLALDVEQTRRQIDFLRTLDKDRAERRVPELAQKEARLEKIGEDVEQHITNLIDDRLDAVLPDKLLELIEKISPKESSD